MQLKLSYNEVERFLAQKAGRSIPMMYGGDHTLRITPEVNVLFKTTSIPLDITIDRINGSDIFLSYSGGTGIEFMVRTALSKMKGQPGSEIIEMLDGNRLLLCLGKGSQSSTLLEHVQLEDIHFDSDSVMIDFHLKQQ